MPPDANASLPMNTSRIPRCCPAEATILSALVEIAQRAVDNWTPQPLVQSSGRGEGGLPESGERGGYRQLGSQISRFHVVCEIGMPVRIGYNQAKFVITRAT